MLCHASMSVTLTSVSALTLQPLQCHLDLNQAMISIKLSTWHARTLASPIASLHPHSSIVTAGLPYLFPG